MRFITTVAVLALLAACSNEQMYSAVQQNQQLECAKLPQNAYEECMRETGTSYREYEWKRQELLKDD